MVELSVVIPAHNEAENLAMLVAEVHCALTGLCEYEVMVADDASGDATAVVVAELIKHNDRVRGVRHISQAGQSSAVVSGIRHARGEWVVTLDGDGQNDPADIVALWNMMQAQSNRSRVVLMGWRNKRRDTWVKIISSRIANGVRAAMLGDATPDSGCGIKLFRREDFMKLPHFDHMHRFLPALFRRLGKTVISVPVNHRPRLKGRSHYGIMNRLWVGIIDMLGVAWLKARPIAVEAKNYD